ncbi:MAG TPA: hypothetical protein PLS49_06395, partial [Candidatus Woesebacteria bacterium]|nr:hypothetical protein [Candidatus Woesebacteria bacterium]
LANGLIPAGEMFTKQTFVQNVTQRSLDSRPRIPVVRYEPGVSGWTVDLQTGYSKKGTEEKISLVPPAEHGIAYCRTLLDGETIPEYVVTDQGDVLVQYHHDVTSLLDGGEYPRLEAVDVWKRKPKAIWTKTRYKPQNIINSTGIVTYGFAPQVLGMYIHRSPDTNAETARLQFASPELQMNFNTYKLVYRPSQYESREYDIGNGAEVLLAGPVDHRVVSSLYIEELNNEQDYHGLNLTPTPPIWGLRIYLPKTIEIPQLPCEMSHDNLILWIESNSQLARGPESNQMQFTY